MQSCNCGVIVVKVLYMEGDMGTPAPELDGISSLIHCIPSFITPHACARGKVIGCVVIIVVHKNLQILRFRHLSDSKVQ